MPTITITQPSNFPDIEAARLAAAKSIAPTATTAIGTKFNGVSTESASSAYPHGVSHVSIHVDSAAVTAAAS